MLCERTSEPGFRQACLFMVCHFITLRVTCGREAPGRCTRLLATDLKRQDEAQPLF
jgi:hypothetical protein